MATINPKTLETYLTGAKTGTTNTINRVTLPAANPAKNDNSQLTQPNITTNAYSTYLTQLQQQQAAAQQRAEQLAAQKQAAAQQAYDQNMSALNTAYDNRYKYQGDNYNNAISQLDASYNSSASKVNANADNAQQQAYINYMMSKRDMPQSMIAQGLSGGASESTMANMYNQYGNSRNTVDTNRNENLAQLLDTLNTSKSSALQSYNSALANDNLNKLAYEMQLRQNLSNSVSDILTAKYDALDKVDTDYSAQMEAMQKTAAQAAAKSHNASNTSASNNVTQAADITKKAAYSRALLLYQNGGSDEDIYNNLKAAGHVDEDIDEIMKALGL